MIINLRGRMTIAPDTRFDVAVEHHHSGIEQLRVWPLEPDDWAPGGHVLGAGHITITTPDPDVLDRLAEALAAAASRLRHTHTSRAAG